MLIFAFRIETLLNHLSDTINESLTKCTDSIFLRLILGSLCNALPYLTKGGSCNLPTPGILHAQDTLKKSFSWVNGNLCQTTSRRLAKHPLWSIHKRTTKFIYQQDDRKTSHSIVSK